MKAQAALEFLMTYGWAFLIILVMIGALTYYGVLSPDNLLSDSIRTQPPFLSPRGDFKITQTEDMTVAIKLLNGNGASINVDKATFSLDYEGGCADNPDIWLDADRDGVEDPEEDLKEASGNDIRWKEEEDIILYVDCGADAVNLPLNSKIKVNIDLYWRPSSTGGDFAKKSNIELYTNVQE